MSAKLEQSVVAQVLAALQNDQLELPTLPEVALKIRKALDDPNVSADQLINYLSFDPVISAQIIQASNSAAFSNEVQIVSVRQAIMRLGYRTLRNLVISATLTKLFQSDRPRVEAQLKKLWQHSQQVAANCHVLASAHKHLIPEEAMLAGLVHDIGALPLYLYADTHCKHLDEAALEQLVCTFHSTVGVKLLQHWKFSDEIIAAVQGHEDFGREGDASQADYTDVLMMANLQTAGSTEQTAWENVPATLNLGLGAEECRNFLADNASQLAKVNNLFGVYAAKPKPVRMTAQTRPAPPEPGGFWARLRNILN